MCSQFCVAFSFKRRETVSLDRHVEVKRLFRQYVNELDKIPSCNFMVLIFFLKDSIIIHYGYRMVEVRQQVPRDHEKGRNKFSLFTSWKTTL